MNNIKKTKKRMNLVFHINQIILELVKIVVMKIILIFAQLWLLEK